MEKVRKIFVPTLNLVFKDVGSNKVPDQSFSNNIIFLDLKGGDLEEDEEDHGEGDEVSPDVDCLIVDPEHALQDLLGSVVPDPVPAFDEFVPLHERWRILQCSDKARSCY